MERSSAHQPAGQAALNDDPPVLALGAQTQPGASKQYRMVFDVDAEVSEYTLEAAGNRFEIHLAS